MFLDNQANLDEEHRDAVNLLYSNSFAGLLVSVAASSMLVLMFETPEVQESKQTWWLLISLLLLLRFFDTLYWKFKLENTPYQSKIPFIRSASGSIATAVLWCSYVFVVTLYASLTEMAFTLVIISAMAGGSATVLAGSKLVSISYSCILLIPSSLYMLLAADYLMPLAGLGIIFGVVMIFSANKAANFTKHAIHIKHQNSLLMDKMQEEKAEVTRVNNQLTLAYDALNESKSSLESKVIRRTAEIHKLSNLDPLTKLYNRNAFIRALEKQVELSKMDGTSIAILFIDLDGFKQINDALGHEVGDDVLRVVTTRLLDLRADGNIGRWGGDEFVLALPNRNAEQAISHAQMVIHSIAKTIKVESLKLNIGASIGISLSPEHGVIERQLIQFADIAMYEHKNSGEKLPRVFSSDLLVELQQKERYREGLRDAISNNELFVLYQPVMDAFGEKVVSCEALLRWSFNSAIIPPTIFIEIAEQSGLIIEIGRWVLKQACVDAAHWNKQHSSKVSINVSMVQLLDEAFIDYLDEALQSSQLPANQLILEITESTFAENQEYIRHLLNAIKQRNVCISIDDFGTGYSSMSQLQMLPFDIIKIDRPFVNNIQEKGEAIIKATLFIAKELKCKTVAEGVETLEQAHALNALGADYFQGFYFAKPLTLIELQKYQQIKHIPITKVN